MYFCFYNINTASKQANLIVGIGSNITSLN